MRTTTHHLRATGVFTLLVLGAAACADSTAPRPSNTAPSPLSLLDAGQPGVGVWVCAVSTIAPYTFSFTGTASNTEGTLANSPIDVDVLTANADPAEYCSRAWTPGVVDNGLTTDVTVAEIVPAGFKVDSILVVTTPPGGREIFYNVTSKTVTASFTQGYLLKFFNSQIICTDQNASNYGQPGECKYPPPPSVGTGCTPGYWKVAQHWDSWPAGYAPTQLIGTYFPNASLYSLSGKAMSNYTLVKGLAFKGGSDAAGGAEILLRAGIAGMLNTATFGSGYPMTNSQLVTSVNNALGSGDRAAMVNLGATIDKYNNGSCTLN